MATIKVHAFVGDNDGTESCDFRGSGELGAGAEDQHRTLLEEEFGPDVNDNERIQEVLADGPEWNRITKSLLKGMKPSGVIGELLSLIGGKEGLRIGVWDA